MTCKTLVVLIRCEEDGNTYQVALTKDESDCIRRFISVVHNGEIKVLPDKLLLKLDIREVSDGDH